MHDSLHLRNVSKLPSSFRSIALAAANGSLPDLEKVCMAVSFPGFHDGAAGAYTVLWLLPVLYIHLDPANIPTPDEVDRSLISTTAIPAVEAASLVLKATSELVALSIFPTDVSLDLWFRVWPWMQFMDTYWEFLPTFDPKEKLRMTLSNCDLVARLRGNGGEATLDIISAQYGLRSIFSRAWTAVLLDGTFEGSDLLPSHIFRLLPTLSEGMERPGCFEEVVDGVDGNLERLASALIKHTSYVLADSRHDVKFGFSMMVTSFLSGSAQQEKFVALLLSRGIITHLMGMIKVLELEDDIPREMIEAAVGPKRKFWYSLVRYFATPPGYLWIAEAIRGGLLPILISYATRRKDYANNVEAVLHSFLPLSLVWPSVIIEMNKALIGIEKYSGQPRFKESRSFADWEALVSLVKERVVILAEWEATRRLSSMACDNITCGKIAEKSKFKRCGGCLTVNYCSSGCQSTDWQHGHRAVCDDLRVARGRYPERIPARERSFLRALVHHDYEDQKINLAVREIWYMRHFPGKDYVVNFDYSKSRTLNIQLETRTGFSLRGHSGEAELPMLWEKQARSEGRMMIHFACVVEGNCYGPRLFPLRAASGASQLALAAISRIPTDCKPNSDEEAWADEDCVRQVLAQFKLKGVNSTAIH
ncbi:hypothetical protein C8R46DRAFT_1355914 [Mycena filopes]|nr:hypothetical protein C8R46DRAFT_1355914 [Mycena filopes]